jgi:NAD(P)-dependent dehydrogenase (short-subunit alcohol dehydrogenase family)
MRGIKGKIVIVTGGARGLGKSMVDRFLKEGAIVISADILKKELEKSIASFKNEGFTTEGYVIDVRSVPAIVKSEMLV